MNVTDHSVQGFPGNSVVLLWANLRSETSGENSLSGSFSENSNAENHVCCLEDVSDDIEVSCGEDKEDDRSISDPGGSWVLPREETAKEAMVMCKRLPGSSRCCGRLS